VNVVEAGQWRLIEPPLLSRYAISGVVYSLKNLKNERVGAMFVPSVLKMAALVRALPERPFVDSPSFVEINRRPDIDHTVDRVANPVYDAPSIPHDVSL
jgi:hypothetical protein